ncbi:DUF6933 domain-containing protein [Paenibacillus spongiae]|uniref:DUF6933 domain-containing protein n=1 Tax=Paenibacillus spongiae TaxID=2909671 RepID=A0ABY5SAL3_9BACL|nr:hypothetical protein [Paenibacillus spongiae]UVI29338.1 hypothetical protein L1F29_28570 [Paenibacillus spongiae]
MLYIKATKDTLKDLNAKPHTVESTDPFFSWHVNFFTLYGKKHYVFINDLSRMSLSVTGIRSNSTKVQEIFLTHLCHYFALEHIPEALMNAYLDNCKEYVLTKTDSRSVLGTLNEVMLTMKTLESGNEELKDQDTRHKWNNRLIYKPIDYERPIDVFKKELKERFGKARQTNS